MIVHLKLNKSPAFYRLRGQGARNLKLQAQRVILLPLTVAAGSGHGKIGTLNRRQFFGQLSLNPGYDILDC